MRPVYIFLCLIFFCSGSTGQNLIRNPGFEEHIEFPYGMDPFYWGIKNLRHWTTTGWSTISYCHLDLENRVDTVFRKTSCCGNTINPHGGKGMVKLGYTEACPSIPSTGCAPYLKSVLSSPLVVGEVYEVSMWVHFPRNMGED